MKDFDAQRRERHDSTRDARTFRLGDEEFVVKAAIKPETLADYENLKSEDSATHALEVIDELVVSFLEPVDAAEDRYRAIRAREDDPIALADLEALVEWLVETQTARPTGRPGSSSRGPASTGTKSTEDSLSLVSAGESRD